ncbi:protein ALP1-like [Rana temporaria]|uniref:protein ALP1-like n=1 Tax=Rana temporaria TaxID=8407 RepID=UPI001AACC130|nr:protein ALP1-like [Rana temporaria]
MFPTYLSYSFDVLLWRSQARRIRDAERRRQRRRRYWIHPITASRMTHGVHSTLYVELRQHPDKFASYLRMSVSTFDDLLARISERIRRQDTHLRRSISPEERLIVTLRFLASGESFSSLHFQFRLGISTISGIVRSTCDALWDCLVEEFIPQPSTELWLQIAAKYHEVTQFPNCVGAIDGKHIRIQKPAHTGSEYFNYKKFFSTILMAIADAQYRFVAVDIGSYGRTNDSRVFKNSVMGRRIYSGEMGLPEPRAFPGTDEPPMPFVFIGDEAFQMCGNLLKPYSSRGLDQRKRIFNYRLSGARRYVECAFGIFAGKWRIFNRPIQLHPDVVDQVVKAAVVLHNFILTKEPSPSDPEEVESALPGIEQISRRATQVIMRLRDDFSQYFLTEAGMVSWQDRMM